MKFSTFVIWLAALFFLLYGIAFAIQPSGMIYLVTELEPNTASGLVDLRATYGGMTVAVGGVILYLWRMVSVEHSLFTVIIVLLAMALTRMIGFMLEGPANFIMYAYLAAEILGAGMAFYALRINYALHINRTTSSQSA